MADSLASSLGLVTIYEEASVREFTSLLEEGRSDVTFSQIETQAKLAGLRAIAYAAWQKGVDDSSSDTPCPANPYRDRL